ncbi:hypothetical protein [Ancylobacter pratisalsi]|uniref:Uncharacterized protein n=1 Tax=Ancylobacter pratisalsi TaxID=1745854 RepID=A0A6P1YHV3_9HYPH|nr:hypothetical protein [Ancylobacter pratisalsi]QIB32665.1 hypothetical protein G3A50_02320 [Ancylobacter pratisalsi]
MKLYAVRLMDTCEAVGVFWAPDVDELWVMVDAAADPGQCEFCLLKGIAAILWEGRTEARFGKAAPDDEEGLSSILEDATLEWSLGDMVWDEGARWKRLPLFDEPGGGFDIIKRERKDRRSC